MHVIGNVMPVRRLHAQMWRSELHDEEQEREKFNKLIMSAI